MRSSIKRRIVAVERGLRDPRRGWLGSGMEKCSWRLEWRSALTSNFPSSNVRSQASRLRQ
jgi:hypothetical protein